MRKLVYHVGMSIDNFISHEDGSMEGFLSTGDHAQAFLQSLDDYDTVLMGRATYEWGYRHGMQPGQPGYPHLQHYVFSKTLRFEEPLSPKVTVVIDEPAQFVRDLKSGAGPDLFLCGGGKLAGYLLGQGLIDQLKIKLYPVLLGHGIRLFGSANCKLGLTLTDVETYTSGVLLLSYNVIY